MTLLMTALLATNLQLAVRVYDSVGLPPAELQRAQAGVGVILASVGIEPIWHPCHVSTCTGPVKPHEVVLRLVKSGPESARGSLGFSLVDVSLHAGSLGTIYADRVHALAMQASVDEGELLGRAIAHEIGHMLLGTSGHSRFGLMRAVWVSQELRRGRPSDWLFSGREGAELRQRLVARSDSAPTSETVLAALGSVDIDCAQ
jgi:hypothetical protein